MPLHRIRAVFMRGGTSKALMFREEDLPTDRAQRDAIFLSAMGVPDPNGRNLDGMGGGLSSLNKVCIVGPTSRADADVDYTFVQLTPDTATVDYGGNCGNMSSAIGPFAIEEGIIPTPPDGEAVVRIHNTNTGKIIAARFPVEDGALAAEGDFALDGIAGTAAPVKLEFLEPGGAKTGKLLPTGNPIDILTIPLPRHPRESGDPAASSDLAVESGTPAFAGATGEVRVEVSIVDAANPCVFVAADSIGRTGAELPTDLDKDAEFLATMEAIRQAASVKMGLAPDLAAAAKLASIPKVAMLAAPQDAPTLSGVLAASEHDLAVRMISVGQPHRAVPITGAICLAVAARIPGTIANRLSQAKAGPIRIGHASGTTVVDASVVDGKAEYGAVYRSARRLFEGSVVYRL